MWGGNGTTAAANGSWDDKETPSSVWGTRDTSSSKPPSSASASVMDPSVMVWPQPGSQSNGPSGTSAAASASVSSSSWGQVDTTTKSSAAGSAWGQKPPSAAAAAGMGGSGGGGAWNQPSVSVSSSSATHHPDPAQMVSSSPQTLSSWAAAAGKGLNHGTSTSSSSAPPPNQATLSSSSSSAAAGAAATSSNPGSQDNSGIISNAPSRTAKNEANELIKSRALQGEWGINVINQETSWNLTPSPQSAPKVESAASQAPAAAPSSHHQLPPPSVPAAPPVPDYVRSTTGTEIWESAVRVKVRTGSTGNASSSSSVPMAAQHSSSALSAHHHQQQQQQHPQANSQWASPAAPPPPPPSHLGGTWGEEEDPGSVWAGSGGGGGGQNPHQGPPPPPHHHHHQPPPPPHPQAAMPRPVGWNDEAISQHPAAMQSGSGWSQPAASLPPLPNPQAHAQVHVPPPIPASGPGPVVLAPKKSSWGDTVDAGGDNGTAIWGGGGSAAPGTASSSSSGSRHSTTNAATIISHNPNPNHNPPLLPSAGGDDGPPGSNGFGTWSPVQRKEHGGWEEEGAERRSNFDDGTSLWGNPARNSAAAAAAAAANKVPPGWKDQGMAKPTPPGVMIPNGMSSHVGGGGGSLMNQITPPSSASTHNPCLPTGPMPSGPVTASGLPAGMMMNNNNNNNNNNNMSSIINKPGNMNEMGGWNKPVAASAGGGRATGWGEVPHRESPSSSSSWGEQEASAMAAAAAAAAAGQNKTSLPGTPSTPSSGMGGGGGGNGGWGESTANSPLGGGGGGYGGWKGNASKPMLPPGWNDGQIDTSSWGTTKQGKPLTKDMIQASMQFRILTEKGFKKDDVENALRASGMVMEGALELLKNGSVREANGLDGDYSQMKQAIVSGNSSSLLNNSAMTGGASLGMMNPMNRSPLQPQPQQQLPPINQAPSALVGGSVPRLVAGMGSGGGGGGGGNGGGVVGGGGGNQASNQYTNQLRTLVQQIQLAVQAGHLNPQILNQPLAPPTLGLLYHLLQEIKTLQNLNQLLGQGVGGGGPPSSSSAAVQELHVRVTKTKQAITNLQNNIAANQATFLKHQQNATQQQQQQQHQQQLQPQDHFNKPNDSSSSSSRPLPIPQSQPTHDLNSLNNGGGGGGGSGGGQSRLSQWKMTSFDKADEFDALGGRSGLGSGGGMGGGLQKSSPLADSLASWNDMALAASHPVAAASSWTEGPSSSSAAFLISKPTKEPTMSPPVSSFADLVPEFEPGKPWKGTTKSIEDDPTMTPGSLAGRPSLSLAGQLGSSSWSSTSSNSHKAAAPVSDGLAGLSFGTSSTWSFSNPSNSLLGAGGGGGGGGDGPLANKNQNTGGWTGSNGEAAAASSSGSDMWGMGGGGGGLAKPRPPPGLSSQMKPNCNGPSSAGIWNDSANSANSNNFLLRSLNQQMEGSLDAMVMPHPNM